MSTLGLGRLGLGVVPHGLKFRLVGGGVLVVVGGADDDGAAQGLVVPAAVLLVTFPGIGIAGPEGRPVIPPAVAFINGSLNNRYMIQ